MKTSLKITILALYFSIGIFFGILVRYLPDPSFFHNSGLVILGVLSLLGPLVLTAFGWLNQTSKISRIWIYVISIIGTAIWFILSSIAVSIIGIGHG